MIANFSQLHQTHIDNGHNVRVYTSMTRAIGKPAKKTERVTVPTNIRIIMNNNDNTEKRSKKKKQHR